MAAPATVSAVTNPAWLEAGTHELNILNAIGGMATAVVFPIEVGMARTAKSVREIMEIKIEPEEIRSIIEIKAEFSEGKALNWVPRACRCDQPLSRKLTKGVLHH